MTKFNDLDAMNDEEWDKVGVTIGVDPVEGRRDLQG